MYPAWAVVHVAVATVVVVAWTVVVVVGRVVEVVDDDVVLDVLVDEVDEEDEDVANVVVVRCGRLLG